MQQLSVRLYRDSSECVIAAVTVATDRPGQMGSWLKINKTPKNVKSNANEIFKPQSDHEAELSD